MMRREMGPGQRMRDDILRAARLAGLAVVLGLWAAAPAAAYRFTGMPLADVLDIAKPYPNLVLQIRLQLVRANLKREQVTCLSERVPDGYSALAGRRMAPYHCPIGRRTLVVTAAQTYYDAGGRKLSPRDPDLARKAAKVTEAGLKWTWK